MNDPLIIPMFCHIAITAGLYVLLTLLRAPAVWNVGVGVVNQEVLNALEVRTSANLRNQFEWPIFFMWPVWYCLLVVMAMMMFICGWLGCLLLVE